jgi:peptide/nickel transport system permease protein
LSIVGDPAECVARLQEMRDRFREIHGLNDPLLVQFGRYAWDVVHLDFGYSIRKARMKMNLALKEREG